MSVFCVQLDGNKIKDYQDLINEMQNKMHFPRDCQGSIDRYLDWMRDLSWIQSDIIYIHILNSRCLMSDKPNDRKAFLEDFEEIIIPFWKYEADIVIVDGRKRNIFLKMM